jgi:hypothetical protein
MNLDEKICEFKGKYIIQDLTLAQTLRKKYRIITSPLSKKII